ncbi:MAG TPA: hypothetical protein VER79_00815 [Candidatus Limnocylindrales bacterium]|nr:hypothetical protein [Candidatus Limnocylindrales bacterium]
MTLNDLSNILMNAYILFTVILGVWSLLMGARSQPISGNFWGAVATITILAASILAVGGVMYLTGLRPPRPLIYLLYMLFLVIIMPGLFTMLRGRDDRGAAIAFGLLCFFNAFTSLSMIQRHVLGPWTLPPA